MRRRRPVARGGLWRQRGWCAAASVLIIGALILALWPAHVRAHALLVRSTPAANDRLTKFPSTVDLWFSEPLDRSFSRVEVRDQNGQRVDEGRVEFNPGDETQMSVRLKVLTPGIFVVSWRTLSTVDGHQWTGSYPFIVLNPDGTVPEGSSAAVTSQGEIPSPVLALGRWAELLSGTLLVGGLACYLLVSSRALGVLTAAEAESIALPLRWRLFRWTAITAAAFVVASLFGLYLQVESLGGLDSLIDFLFRSRPGHLLLLRLGLVSVTATLLLAAARRQPLGGTRIAVISLLALLSAFLLATSGYGWIVMLLVLVALGLIALAIKRGEHPESLLAGNALLWIGLVCAAGSVLTFSLLSHAGALSVGSFWGVAMDAVHLLAVAFWFGGLVGMLIAFRAARGLSETSRSRYLAGVVVRFSPLAALSVALIVASGIFSSATEVPSLQALVQTAYGRALLVKLALVAILLAIAGANAFVFGPRLGRAAGVRSDAPASPSGAPSSVNRWRRRLLTMVVLEAAAGVLVLASVGVLSQIPPSRTSIASSEAAPKVEDQPPFEQTVTAADTRVTLRVTPNRAGINQFVVRIDGMDPRDVQRVRLTFLTTDQTFGGSSGVAELSPEGDWRLEGPYFTFGGPWQVIVDIRRVEKDDVSAGYRLLVAGPLPPKNVEGSAFGAPESAINLNTLVGAYATAAGLWALTWRRGRRSLGRLSTPTLVGSAATVFIGLMLVFGVHSHLRPAAQSADTADQGPEAIARGAEIFQQNCVQCHGVAGKGDGPLAPTLNPRPVDLTQHVPFHPDEQLLYWISNGVPGSAMPAFKEVLSERERKDVLAYLRNLSVPQSQ